MTRTSTSTDPGTDERADGGKALEGHVFGGLLGNAVRPWGDDLLWAPVVLGGQRIDETGSLRYPEVLTSGHPLLDRVLRERWAAEFVLGDRDPRPKTVAPE